jgi:diaminopimelate decarboxylase
MSDVDEGDRGAQEFGGRLPRELTKAAREILTEKKGFTMDGNAIWHLIHGVEVLHAMVLSQQTTIDSLQEDLETYMRRSAPALSAARMHVPIGGGDTFWKRQQARKQAETKERVRAKLDALKARTDLQKQADVEAFNAFFTDPEVAYEMGLVEKPKRVQRKRRAKKVVRRK